MTEGNRRVDPGSEDYEATVLRALTAAVRAYCVRAESCMGRHEHVTVRVRLAVTTPPGDEARGAQEALVHHYVTGEFPRAEVELDRSIEPDLPQPGYRIRFEPSFGTGPVGALSGYVPYPRQPSIRTLAIDDGGTVTTFPLVPAAGWVLFGRRVPTSDGRQPFQLPNAADHIPRGALVEFCCHGHRCEVRRTGQRTDYTVLVNGRRLVPGDVVHELPESGTVVYQPERGQPTTLAYRLTRQRRHGSEANHG